MAKIVSHYGKRSWETIGKPSGNNGEMVWETQETYINIKKVSPTIAIPSSHMSNPLRKICVS